MNGQTIHAGQIVHIVIGEREIIGEVAMKDGQTIYVNGERFSVRHVVDICRR